MSACALALLASSAHADGVPFHNGDVLAGIGQGKIAHFSPTGTLLDTLDTTTGSSEDTGMCFDSAGNLYTTNFSSNNMSKFNPSGNLVAATFATGFASSPESCTVDASNNIYVGQGNGSAIFKFDASGNQLATYAFTPETRGSDWVDIAQDQCTIHVADEGGSIQTFNVCTNAQGPDFATGLAGPCYGHRILADGGELISCSTHTYRVNSSGTVVQTYTPTGGPAPSTLFSLNLDPDGTSFWTADLFSGQIWRIDIASGNTITTFNSNQLNDTAGVAVVGEITAGQPQKTLTVTKAGSGSGTATSSPAGINCGTTCSGKFAPGTAVTLTAAPQAGSSFAGWSGGGCSGTGTCTVTLTADTTVTATFNVLPAGSHELLVQLAGKGKGKVSDSAGAISCPTKCSHIYATAAQVTLHAKAASGSRFAGWSGGGCPSSGTCTVSMTSNRTVRATFTKGSSSAAPRLRITHVDSHATQEGCTTELAFITELLGEQCTNGQLTISGTINPRARGKVHLKVTYDLGNGQQTAKGTASIAGGHWKTTLTVTGINRDPHPPIYSIAARFNGSKGVRAGKTSRKITLEVELGGLGPK